MTTLRTFGHGTLTAEAFASLLDGARVGRVVDVRSFPGSRHNPQFGREEMERWVPDAGHRLRLDARIGRSTPTDRWLEARCAAQRRIPGLRRLHGDA